MRACRRVDLHVCTIGRHDDRPWHVALPDRLGIVGALVVSTASGILLAAALLLVQRLAASS